MSVFTVVNCCPSGRVDEGELIWRCPDNGTVFVMNFMEFDRQLTAEGSKYIWQCRCCEVTWSRILAQWVPEQIDC